MDSCEVILYNDTHGYCSSNIWGCRWGVQWRDFICQGVFCPGFSSEVSTQDLLYGITDGIHFSMKHFILFLYSVYKGVCYNVVFLPIYISRSHLKLEISEGSSLKRCDYNNNAMNKQFEHVHCINLKTGSKIMQGMHQLMPWNNESVRKTVSF